MPRFDDLSPSDAWQPLPAAQFDEAAARHLLRRIGFAALPAQVAEAVQAGPLETINRAFQRAQPFPLPPRAQALVEDTAEYLRRQRGAMSEEERRRLQREARERTGAAFNDLSVRWLRHAAVPANSAREKFVLFLGDVLVVAAEKVRNPRLLHQHQQLLRDSLRQDYPTLLKAVSRSPAMVVYLDLQQSGNGRPNENFARELFELFSLGEGNYTEDDIKEAARAFTGYRQRFGEFYFDRREFDDGSKRVFGRTGRFDGDGIIDLVFEQPAAATFLPRELCRFYLAEEPLEAPYLQELGRLWRGAGFNLMRLVERVFTSRAFYHPSVRGNLIKSPVQFYIGLTQDLGIHVAPFTRPLNSLRQMGQRVYDPPNVRGWVGGKLWINSSTLAARRALVESLFTPVDEAALNADDLVELVAARAEAEVQLYVSRERLQALGATPSAEIASRFADYFLPVAGPGFTTALQQWLDAPSDDRVARVRSAAIAVLQSPNYQLC